MPTLKIEYPVDCPAFTFDDLLQFLKFNIECEMRDAEECIQDRGDEEGATEHFARAAAALHTGMAGVGNDMAGLTTGLCQN